MNNDGHEVDALVEGLVSLTTRLNKIVSTATAVNATELAADLVVVNARLQSLNVGVAGLHEAPGGTTPASRLRTIEKLRRSMDETDRSLSGLDSLLKEVIHARRSARFKQG